MILLANRHVIVGELTWEHVGLAVLISILGTLARNLPYMKRKEPKINCRAVTKSKRLEYSNTPQINYRGNRYNFLITFIKEDGTEIELYTGETNYEMFDEGDAGNLTYQGDKLIEFVWDNCQTRRNIR